MSKIGFHTSLTLFIRCLFASKRSALPKGDSPTENTLIRVARQLEYRATTLLWLTWTQKVFRICRCIKRVEKVLFNSPTMTHPRISKTVAIVWYSTQQGKLTIHSVNIDLHDSVTINKKRVVNPFIFWGQLSCPHVLMTIGIQDIIVKLAHRAEKSIIHFFQCPNTVESTWLRSRSCAKTSSHYLSCVRFRWRLIVWV